MDLSPTAILCNNINLSYDKNKHQLLNPEKIAIASKYTGIEPKIVFKNLFVQTAYNLEHQGEIAEEISDKIESNPYIKLLAIRDLTKFLVRDTNASDDVNTLKKTLGTVYRACIKNKVAIVATGDCNVANNGFIPKPAGGTYLKHTVNIIVHIKPNFWSTPSNVNSASPYVSLKASMIKHPYQKTPKSVNFYMRRIGKRRNPMLFILD